MPSGKPSRFSRASGRGSVLIVVLVMLLFTAGVLTLFIDKASTDLIVESRRARAERLRSEAYSALEVTLAVLNQFVQADANALRSPHEGWGDPLGFAGWTPSEDRVVEVTFEDESAKISLPNVDAATLTDLFVAWELPESEAEELADALLAWMKPNHLVTTNFLADYDQAELPYAPPQRSLLSFDELAAINLAAQFFYDGNGRPNAYWHRFADTFSLYNYAQPNLNAFPIKPDVLTALGKFSPESQQQLADYLGGTGVHEGKGPQYFKLRNDANAVLGPGGNLGAFNNIVRALRIHVTVREGDTSYRLTAMISPPNGATPVQSTATNDPTAASTATAGNVAAAGPPGAAQGRGGAAGAARGGAAGGGRGGTGATGAAANSNNSLSYPFTVIEIRENYEPPPAQAPAEDTPPS